jgi:glyoxylase-like metal-dependent hydrolase (beta-lactamase superfamily II)
VRRDRGSLEIDAMIRIYAMCCGRLEFDRSLFFPDDPPGRRLNVEVPSYLILHPRGVALFDTGVDCLAQQDPVARLGSRIARTFALTAKPHENIVDQLRSVGLSTADVTHVINSHFHFDHCGCNALFPHARFIVQSAEMEAARAPTSPYNPAHWNHPFDYLVVDGEHDVFADGALVLIPTPGHTAGHQSLRVHAAPGVDFLFTADACYSREHLDREIVPASGAAWSRTAMVETFARLRALRDRHGCTLLFGHDTDQWAGLRHAPDPLN